MSKNQLIKYWHCRDSAHSRKKKSRVLFIKKGTTAAEKDAIARENIIIAFS